MNRMKILIVEDRESISGAIREMLSVREENEIAIAGSGKEALSLFSDFNPDLIIMDILLPDMNGLDLARDMIAEDEKVRIIAMSAMANDDLRKNSLEAGCEDLLIKPFRMKELLEKVDSFRRGSVQD